MTADDVEAWVDRQLATLTVPASPPEVRLGIARPDPGPDAAPPGALLGLLVECLAAGRCAACGTAFAEPGDAMAQAVSKSTTSGSTMRSWSSSTTKK